MDIKHHVYSSEAESSAIYKENGMPGNELACQYWSVPSTATLTSVGLHGAGPEIVSGWTQALSAKAVDLYPCHAYIVQELCESRGGRPGLSVLTSLLVSVDVKLY